LRKNSSQQSAEEKTRKQEILLRWHKLYRPEILEEETIIIHQGFNRFRLIVNLQALNTITIVSNFAPIQIQIRHPSETSG